MFNPFRIILEIIKDTIERIAFVYLPFPMKIEKDEKHLEAVIGWLEQAIYHGKGGVSSHFSLIKRKWADPFPETTGYIIPTLYDYSHFTGHSRYFDLATDLTKWLVKVQMENGACIQGTFSEKKKNLQPVIFNTGQNLLGFIRTYKETGEEKFLHAALKAGEFLISSVDEKGVWNKNLHRNLKHTINTRAAWALLELHNIHSIDEYVSIAISNLDWAHEQQTDNGWLKNGTSRVGGLPNTHFLSYTCEGFFQSYKILKEKKYFDSAEKTAGRLMRIFENRKMLHAFWDENWKNRGRYFRNGKGKYLCVTGNIQISLVWMWLYEETGDHRYLNSAFKMLDYIKTIQNINSKHPGIYGGIKGSYPIYGSYSTMSYPNWAAKYFADAIMFKISLMKKVKEVYNKQLNENYSTAEISKA